MYVPHERRALILRLLEQRGYLRSAELARELGVTEETIRTDLIAMHERRLLSRVHGGARFIPPAGGTEDSARLDCQLIDRIIPHLKAGMTIFADAGPFAVSLFGRMNERPCTVLTASPRLILSLSAKAIPHHGIMPGGEIDKESHLISADNAEAFFRKHKPDIALLCPPSIPAPDHVAYHLTTRAKWAQAAIHAANFIILVGPAHAFYTQAATPVPCKPHLLVAEDNLPDGFEALPSELIPYLSPADVRQQDDI